MALTALQCTQAKPKEKPYKLTDGAGLYLEVMPNGSKFWRHQYSYLGKRPRISLGTYPEMSLSEARDKHTENRKLLKEGENPAIHRRREKLRKHLAAGDTFEKIAREWHELNNSGWKPAHAADVLQRFEKDVFPEIGRFPISEIYPPDVLATVKKIEKRGAGELARRALQNIGRVYRYAIATSRAQTDPTYGLKEAMKPLQKTNYSALEFEELPDFILALRSNNIRFFPHSMIATELLLLTFVRTGELIGAKWEEIDLENARWTIPAERMKMARAHIVPLSRQAIKLLQQLQELSHGRPYVFPHFSDPRKHMSNGTILKVIKTLGYKDKTTGHGFRALAMSSIKEQLNYRHEVVDRQLAHVPSNKIDRAYDRAKFLSERTIMMQEWADLIDKAYKEALMRAL